VIILGPIINHATRSKVINAETPGGICVVKDQATKDLLIDRLPDIYSATHDPNKTEIQILDPSDTIGNTTYDDETVCVPGTALRKEINRYGVTSMAIDLKVSNFKLSPYGGSARTTVYLRGDFDERPLLTTLDLVGLDYAINLKHLSLAYFDFPNFDEIMSYVDKLEGLTFYACLMSDITPLSGLTNLTRLDISSSQISDLSPISSLINLDTLRLTYDGISDITPLSGLTGLTSLELTGNLISDVAPLANLTKLSWLILDSNQISDITPISNLTNLGRIQLDDNQVSDLTPMANLTRLNNAVLSRNHISNLAPIHNLTSLVSLDVSYNLISDITSLNGLTNLYDLNLSGNRVLDLAPLYDLEHLRWLGLADNQITDLSVLNGLTNITDLNLNDNRISDLVPLSSLTNLGYLVLRNNKISNVAPLADLKNLYYLDISHNQIEDFSPLSGLNLSGYSFEKDGQFIIRYTHGQTIWPAGFKDEQGNLYELEDMSNLTYDQDSQMINITKPDEVAYAGYDCSDSGGGSVTTSAKSSGASQQTCRSAVFFLPSEDNLGFSSKTVNDSKHVDVSQGEEFVYETRATVPSNFQRIALIGPTHMSSYYGYPGTIHELVTVRLVEDVDPRITPLSSELYIDDVPFSDTGFSRYYRAGVSIDGQVVEVNVTPFFLLPMSDPDYVEIDEWHEAIWNNSDDEFYLDGLEEPLVFSLRTTAKLTSGVPSGQTDIPSRSQFYLGLYNFNYNDPYAPLELVFRKFGENIVTVSFLNGAVPAPESEPGISLKPKPPRSGSGKDSTVSVLVVLSLMALGLVGWIFSHRQRRHFN
jgi:internalin A